MSHALYRLGRFAARRPWRVIGAWLVVAAGRDRGVRRLRRRARGRGPVPGLDSQRAADLLIGGRVGHEPD